MNFPAPFMRNTAVPCWKRNSRSIRGESPRGWWDTAPNALALTTKFPATTILSRASAFGLRTRTSVFSASGCSARMRRFRRNFTAIACKSAALWAAEARACIPYRRSIPRIPAGRARRRASRIGCIRRPFIWPRRQTARSSQIRSVNLPKSEKKSFTECRPTCGAKKSHPKPSRWRRRGSITIQDALRTGKPVRPVLRSRALPSIAPR